MSRASSSSAPVVVPSEGDGQRLDNFLLRRLRPLPRAGVYRLIRTGQVRVNGRRAKPLARLRAGDEIRTPPQAPVRPQQREVPRPPRDLAPPPVLLEDDRVLIVNKPAGMAAHGGSGVAFGVIERLRAARPGEYLELAHRLDRGTSGVLVLAKRPAALRELHRQWRENEVDKEYVAACFGEWKKSAARIQAPLRRVAAPDGNRQVTPDPVGGKPADTRARLAEQWPGAALIRAELKTGRTHQLRAHLAHPDLGNLPIIGDDKYGDFRRNRALPPALRGRLFLHARRLTFRHPSHPSPPSAGKKIVATAPLPQEFDALAAFFKTQ